MNNQSVKTNLHDLPHYAWPVEIIRQFEKYAVKNLKITFYELMQRAGQASYDLALTQWPTAKNWLILCGSGNNGGDGYVMARIAHQAGIQVTLLACEDSQRALTQEAKQARDAWVAAGGIIDSYDATWPDKIDLIVDALLGLGINRAPTTPYKRLIDMINQHSAPVLSIDIPSGLVADNGTTPGIAVIANHTISMIALKPGQLIGKARDYVGRLHCNNLGLFDYISQVTAPIMRYDAHDLAVWFKPLKATLHKGNNGRLLVIGGDIGTAGAIRMTAEAALRSGAGLVRVLTRKENISSILTSRPELMVETLDYELLQQALEWSDVIVIGPGLGQREWGEKALKIVKTTEKPMLWDADALNLLAMNPNIKKNRIITPHPREAARLLGVKTREIENDYLHAAQVLAKRYGGVVVLKGAGTVITNYMGDMAIADVGNAGMASAGMGDVLSGIIASLLAQKMALMDAACAGCVLHGAAADRISRLRGMRGMLATDLFEMIWQCINPKTTES